MKIQALEQLLSDPETPEWLLRAYVEEDVESSRPFAPALRVRKEILDPAEWALAPLGGMDRWNKRTHEKRVKKYRSMISKGYTGPRIVSEGDSWFMYPVLLTEIVDHLYDIYAVYSWDAAGDSLQQMIDQDQVVPAIREENADMFILSAGGNDVLGDIAAHLHPYDPDRRAEDYPNDTSAKVLGSLLNQYHQLFDRVLTAAPAVRCCCHGYDYVFPRKDGKWLGRPMHSKLGITDSKLQRDIAAVLVDRFNARLRELASSFGGRVTYVDCRGTVPDPGDWYDEIHPKSDGFGDITAKFVQAMRGS
jgi:hypothetical protein